MYVSIYIYIYEAVCPAKYVYLCVHIYIYLFMYVSIYLYVCSYLCVYLYIYIYVYILICSVGEFLEIYWLVYRNSQKLALELLFMVNLVESRLLRILQVSLQVQVSFNVLAICIFSYIYNARYSFLCIYTNIYLYIHISSAYRGITNYLCTYIHLYIYIICIQRTSPRCLWVSVFVWPVYIYIYVSTCIPTCIHVYTYIYKYIQRPSWAHISMHGVWISKKCVAVCCVLQCVTTISMHGVWDSENPLCLWMWCFVFAVYVYIHIHIYIYIHVHIYMYTYTSYVYTCIYMYIYTYIY